MATRLRGRYGYPADEPFRVTLHPERLEEPLRWKKPQRVFVVSMGDLFHDDVPTKFVEDVFEVMSQCPQHTFLVLTKRPQDIQAKLYEQIGTSARLLGCGDFLPNVWLGVTAENQAAADERIPLLLQTPAAKRFVSCEPLLGSVDLTRITMNVGTVGHGTIGIVDLLAFRVLDFVICGGETGPGARPMHPDWARKLRDDCQAAKVPYFFKQWGTGGGLGSGLPGHPLHDAGFHPGQKGGGRLLDGREWNEAPEQLHHIAEAARLSLIARERGGPCLTSQ